MIFSIWHGAVVYFGTVYVSLIFSFCFFANLHLVLITGIVRAGGLWWQNTVALVHEWRGFLTYHAHHSRQTLRRIRLLELACRGHEHRQSPFLLYLRDWRQLGASRGSFPARDQRPILPHALIGQGLDCASSLPTCSPPARHCLYAHSKDLLPDTNRRCHAQTAEAAWLLLRWLLRCIHSIAAGRPGESATYGRRSQKLSPVDPGGPDYTYRSAQPIIAASECSWWIRVWWVWYQ